METAFSLFLSLKRRALMGTDLEGDVKGERVLRELRDGHEARGEPPAWYIPRNLYFLRAFLLRYLVP